MWPARAAWGLAAYQRLSPEFEARLTCTATETGSYERAARLATTWVSPASDGCIHEHLQRLGAAAADLELPTPAPLPREPQFSLVIMLDGWRARERGPDTVRIMLSGNADQQTAIDAVNQGQVFRFLTKPCPAETMAGVLEAALQQCALIVSERQLLEETLNGAVRVLMAILATVDARSFSRAQTLKKQMGEFLRALGGKTSWECELAAMLAPIGCVTVPSPVLQRYHHGDRSNPAEQEMLSRVPELGSQLIAKIPRLEGVARIVLYQAKNFNGTGFPADAVAGKSIPMGARILKVLADRLDLESRGIGRAEVLEVMRHRPGSFDSRVLEVVLKHFQPSFNNASPTAPRGRRVKVADLHPNDVLLSDIGTTEGLMIIPTGTHLTPTMLELVRNFAKLNNLNEPFTVEMRISSTGLVGG